MCFSKIKHTEYHVDPNITDGVMIGIIFRKIAMIFRGLWHKIFIKKSKGLLFVGKKVQLRCRRKMKFFGSATIEDGQVVIGGGAPEIELSRRLRSYSESISGKEQLSINGFAIGIIISMF